MKNQMSLAESLKAHTVITETAEWEPNCTLQCLEKHQAHLVLALGDSATGTPVACAIFVEKQPYVLYCTYVRTCCTACISAINFCAPILHEISI